MRTIKMNLCEITTRVVFIGMEGEQDHTQVIFDASPILNDYPDATAALSVKPPVGNIYPVAVAKDGTNVVWNVSAADCANHGDGEYQITFTNGTEIIKTFVGLFRVYISIIGNGTAPTPVQEWLQAAQEALGELEELSASAHDLEYGEEATAEIETVGGHKNISIGVPGGKPGEDGFSPAVSVTEITDGHRISVTDAEGTETFDVMNGEPGQPGQPGAPGQPGKDGVSPTVSVTPITDGHQVTITDKTGDHSFDVMNGEKGDPGTPGDPTELIDDSSTTATNKVWSAKKSADEVSNLNNEIGDKQDAPASGAAAGKVLGLALVDGQLVPVWDGFPVSDVQVNGTSILSQGVANVPIADGTNPGVVKVRSRSDGLIMDSSNRISIARPNADEIKAGSTEYRVLSPGFQHQSVYYGLAKAAGADMASVTGETVGQYPEAQKIAIQKMLGIYQAPWELMNDITLNSESGIDLTADDNGTPYNLLGVFIYVFYPANTPTATEGYARYRFYDSNNRYCNAETGKYATSTSAKFKCIYLVRQSNLAVLTYTLQQTTGNQGVWYVKSISDGTPTANSGGFAINLGNITRIALASNDVEPAGTRIQIYAQRAY